MGIWDTCDQLFTLPDLYNAEGERFGSSCKESSSLDPRGNLCPTLHLIKAQIY